MVNRTQEEIMQNWSKDWSTPLVSIQCWAYNQEQYIAQTLNGFLMQETEYPFEVVIHDDASMDSTADIIREYEEKYPKIIRPIYEIENQYSKHDGSLIRIMNKACYGKYIAFCEGDDYWIEPSKLQTQVKWMEDHPEYTMCCSDADIVSSKKTNWTRYSEDCDISVSDMILGGGLWVQTCTTLYKSEIIREYSELDFCKQCHVGDYCWQILSVLQGKVRYFNTRMAAYRYMSDGSWTSKNVSADYRTKINGWRSEVNMLRGFDAYSERKHHSLFEKRIASWVYWLAVSNENGHRSSDEIKEILFSFPEVQNFSPTQRIRLFLLKHHMHFLFELKSKIMGKIRK